MHSDIDILENLLTELSDMTERVARACRGGLADHYPYEIARAIRAGHDLRTALLDIQQTHMHSPNHPYGAAMYETTEVA